MRPTQGDILVSRVFAAVFVSLSMVGIADGSLLRPCSCDTSDAVTHRASVEGRTTLSCCHDAGGQEQGRGCKICPQPREPRSPPSAAAAIEKPARTCLSVALAPLTAVATGDLQPHVFRAMSTNCPWRSAPEGLGVFLI